MERLALAVIVLAAFAPRTVNLDQDGWGAEYYSAAVRGMSSSWTNFFFCAFDPAGFISVDKPPALCASMPRGIALYDLRARETAG